MKIMRLDGHQRGDERTVTITLRGGDDDFIHLIDSLGAGTALAQKLSNDLAAMTGLVGVEPTNIQVASALEAYAQVLRNK